MPSHLRLQSAFEPFSAETTRTYFVSSPPQKKQKMSLTQTYYIASSARSKLGREACKPDHDLRLLVGHANLLDSLMFELQQAEREQESWFNHSVRKMESEEELEPRHVQWAEPIMEEDEDDDTASETSDSDSDSDLEEDFQVHIPLRRLRTPAITITTAEVDAEYDSEEDDEYDDEEFGHTLMRVPSNQQPPELVLDSDESDDESPPASPPQPTMEYTESQRKQAIATTGFYNMKPLSESEQHEFVQDGFFIPERNNALLIATC